MKSIFEYDNFRIYLKDLYDEHRAQDPSLTHRKISKLLGYNSPSFLLLVISGKRNLSEKSINQIVKIFAMKREEGEYFKNLALLNQARTIDERQMFAERLLKNRGYRRSRPLAESQYLYYSHWYMIAIRELAGLKKFREDAHWISEQLSFPASSSEVKNAIEALCKLKLLERDHLGRLLQTSEHLTTGGEVVSAAVAKFHREMIRMASESISKFDREVRDISSMTISIPEKSLIELKAAIQDFRNRIRELSSNLGEPDSIYQLNLQLFPLARDN